MLKLVLPTLPEASRIKTISAGSVPLQPTKNNNKKKNINIFFFYFLNFVRHLQDFRLSKLDFLLDFRL